MAIIDGEAAREEIKMLTFSLDNVIYGVDVTQVREVKDFEGATPIPYAPHYVKGVTNLRGEVVPVIDLRKRIGLTDKKDEKAGIMIIVQDKHPIGVIVDAVVEVLTLPKQNIEPSPENLFTGRSEGVIGVAKHDKDLIVVLDVLKVVSNDTGNTKENIKGFQIQVQNATKQQLT